MDAVSSEEPQPSQETLASIPGSDHKPADSSVNVDSADAAPDHHQHDKKPDDPPASGRPSPEPQEPKTDFISTIPPFLSLSLSLSLYCTPRSLGPSSCCSHFEEGHYQRCVLGQRLLTRYANTQSLPSKHTLTFSPFFCL
jgi:hypothetical protein